MVAPTWSRDSRRWSDAPPRRNCSASGADSCAWPRCQRSAAACSSCLGAWQPPWSVFWCKLAAAPPPGRDWAEPPACATRRCEVFLRRVEAAAECWPGSRRASPGWNCELLRLPSVRIGSLWWTDCRLWVATAAEHSAVALFSGYDFGCVSDDAYRVNIEWLSADWRWKREVWRGYSHNFYYLYSVLCLCN